MKYIAVKDFLNHRDKEDMTEYWCVRDENDVAVVVCLSTQPQRQHERMSKIVASLLSAHEHSVVTIRDALEGASEYLSSLLTNDGTKEDDNHPARSVCCDVDYAIDNLPPEEEEEEDDQNEDLKEGHHGIFKPRNGMYPDHDGKAFEVVLRFEDRLGTKYAIKLSTGETIAAWPEELEVDRDDMDDPIPADEKRCEYCGAIGHTDVIDRRECCPKNG